MSSESPPSTVDAETSSADAEFVDTGDAMRVEQQQPQRTLILLSLIALLLSAISLAGVVYVAHRNEATPEATGPDTRAIEAVADELHSYQQIISTLEERLSNFASTTQVEQLQLRLDNQLKKRLEIYASLPARMSNIERSMASMEGISTGVHDNWLLAEAEYYMQIANAQLQLAGNPQLARLALLQADDRVRQLANPAVMEVRMALSDELRALEVMERPDVEGITLRLSSLAGAVDKLPLKTDPRAPSASDKDPSVELSGIPRAMASLKSAFSDIVSVRRSDVTVQPLIAPQASYFLRANLALQLQIARLALLRGEKAVFEGSLADVDTWLGKYYDTNSTQVRSARQTLAEIESGIFDVAVPDISRSLQLLRKYRTLSAASSDRTESPDTPPVTDH